MRKFSVARPLGLALALGALTASAWSVAALAQDSGQAIPRAKAQNIVNTATAAGQFKTLVSLVQQAGLAGTLSTGGPYTVFAPTDAAFAKVPKKTLSALAADPAKLKAVLLYHVAQGKVTAAQSKSDETACSKGGEDHSISTSLSSLAIREARMCHSIASSSQATLVASSVAWLLLQAFRMLGP